MTNIVTNLRNATLPIGFTSYSTPPSIDSYLALRLKAGLSAKSPAQALPLLQSNSTSHFCYITTNSSPFEPIAMGRSFSDGGWYAVIADIAVLPEYQGRGLGDYIVGQLMKGIQKDGEGKGGQMYVSLVAHGKAVRLYEKHGFGKLEDDRIGMAVKVSGADGDVERV